MNQDEIVRDNEITLKELIEKISFYAKNILSNWWIVAIFCIPIVAYFVRDAMTTPDKYIAEVRYIVEGEGSGGAMGGIGSLLGQFGLNRGSGKSNPQQVIQVAKSKRLIENLLLNKLGGEKSIANEIIDIYQLPDLWKEEYPELENFHFTKDSLSNFNKFERLAFNEVYKFLIGDANSDAEPLLVIKYDKDNGIYTILGKTTSEDLSIRLVNASYQQVRQFFEEKILEEKVTSHKLLKMKSDSIKNSINQKSDQLARFEDENRGLVSKRASALKGRLRLEITGLTSVYAEAVKNFEIADYSLKQSKPFYLLIDQPIPPLKPKRKSVLKSIVLSLIIGVVLGSIFLTGRAIYQQAMLN